MDLSAYIMLFPFISFSRSHGVLGGVCLEHGRNMWTQWNVYLSVSLLSWELKLGLRHIRMY